ncbi:hypothetical protein ES703_26489 [subsurface metagenome]
MFERAKTKTSRAAYKAWETRYKKLHNFKDQELYIYLEKKYQKRYGEKERKRVRDAVRLLGGIKDPDFERIPIWAKRKEGKPLDEIALELNQLLPEYQIQDSGDVYELLHKASPK